VQRPVAGTPQGGVISPLLSNLYLHQFDRSFYHLQGPARIAGAKLVRYADDFVVLARHAGTRLQSWIEQSLESRLGLSLNRDKTRIVSLNQGQSLDFLGYTFVYQRDLLGRDKRYLNVTVSRKALKRARARVHVLTSSHSSHVPLPELVDKLNAYLRGWGQYFGYGYPRHAFRNVNAYTRARLTQHLRRRSQRGYRPAAGVSFYTHFARLGLVKL
jgi:RNA-directed DNA polymerase